jgi:Conjugative transposon protein TcpC
MVRRSSVSSLDSGTESAVYGDESPVMDGRRPATAKAPWSGAGGRWMVWPMRVVLWVAILVIGYRGVMAIALNETPANTNGPASTTPSAPAFPVTLGEAFAMDFGQAYLNFSPAMVTQRAQQLAAFIPANVSVTDPQFGWNGGGTFRLDSEQVAGIDVRTAHIAVVTLLATVNDKMMELGVPLYASGGGIVVSGEPAVLPAPTPVSPPSTPQARSDPAAQRALASQLPAFFQAYANGDQATLNRFLAPGVSLSGLDGAVTFGSIASITVPLGGATRDITVTVNWVFPGQFRGGVGQLATTYDMSVIDQQSGRWYVRKIRASTQPMGTQ